VVGRTLTFLWSSFTWTGPVGSALDDEAPEIRAAALASIGELKIKPLARDVKFHLGDKSEAVRSMAKKVLAELEK